MMESFHVQAEQVPLKSPHFFHSFFSKSHWEEMPSTGLIRMSNILFVCMDTHSSEKVCGIGPYTATGEEQRQAEQVGDGGTRFANKTLFPPQKTNSDHLHAITHQSKAPRVQFLKLSAQQIPTSVLCLYQEPPPKFGWLPPDLLRCPKPLGGSLAAGS